MNLFHLQNGLYWVQSGVLPKQFGHKLFLSLSAQLDMCERVEKNNC